MPQQITELELLQTKCKQTEEALRENEDRYKQLVAAVTDYIYTVKVENGQAVSTSHGPGCVAVTGYTQEEYETDPYLWYQMVHEEDREAVIEQASKVLLEEAFSPLEHRIIHKDGSVRWVSNTPVPHRDEQGQLVACDALIRDITKRKQAEEKTKQDYHIQSAISSILRVSLQPISLDEQLQKILELILKIPWLSLESKGCIFLVEDDPDVLVMKAQHALSDDLLMSCAQVPFGKCLCGMAASTGRTIFADHVDDQHEIRYQGMLSHGHYNVPILSDDRVIGVICMYVKENHQRDKREDEFLTAVANALAGVIQRKHVEEERIKMQEKLMRSEKLAAVGKIAGGIGHDLRNPLNIIDNAALYLSEVLQDMDEHVRKQLNIINRAVQRSTKIVTDLLDFARAKPPSLDRCNINDIVKEALSNMETPGNITLKTQMDEDMPEILIDVHQIQRVFLNIISNAFRAMPEGGSLTIKSRVNSLPSKDQIESGFVEVEFKDTGEGIKEENLKKIFEPLFTTRSKGIGLGMAIVKDIIEKHNGTIDVQSAVGKGTTFTVKLPNKA